MKSLVTLSILAILGLASAASVSAQTTSYWSQCADGASIVRCETFNCPNGDTNLDGRCDLKDNGAQLTESRNDSFCANPASGCGEVLYYATNQSASCAVRVKENGNNCNLYKAGNPSFGTAAPASTIAPSATPISRLDTTAKTPAPTAKPGTTTLPRTGPELWASIFVAAIGMYGLYLYEKPKKDTD